MRSKSLDDLISEVYKEGSLFLENSLNRQQAIDILKGYGINSSFNLNDPVILNGLQRNLSNKYNPNQGGNTEDFQKINAAFETLKNSTGNQQPSNQQPSNQQPKFCVNCGTPVKQIPSEELEKFGPPKFCAKCGKPLRVN